MTFVEFINAVYTENISMMQELQQYLKQYDTRITPTTVPGFAGIHYAAFLPKINSLKHLLTTDMTLKTQQMAVFQTPHYQNAAFQVVPGQDILHLSIARKNLEAVNLILQTPNKQLSKLSLDSAGASHLELLCKFPTSFEIEQMLENEFLIKQSKLRINKYNSVQICVLNRRYLTLLKLYKQCAKFNYLAEFYSQFLQIYQGNSIYNIANIEIDKKLHEIEDIDQEKIKQAIDMIWQEVQAFPGLAIEKEQFKRKLKHCSNVSLVCEGNKLVEKVEDWFGGFGAILCI